MIQTLDLTPHVVVEPVKYSHQVIRRIEHLNDIQLLLTEEINKITDILPTIITKYSILYPYTNTETCKASFRRALNDTLSGDYPIRNFLRFLRRIYICSGLAQTNEEFDEKIVEMYQLAKYMEANK